MLQLTLFVIFLIYSSTSLHSATHGKHNFPKILNLVTKRGYPSETHQVTTSDGYILTIFRIPHGKTTKKISNKPVLLLHGMFAVSDQFLVSDETHGLGYVLADNGYDVWLGNCRGTTYSRNHTSLNPDKDKQFWDFSWHEIGMFDLPAMIDHISKVTDEEKLHYIGYSQGTTVFYVLATTRPEYNSRIKAQISVAPAAFVGNIRSPFVRRMLEMSDPIMKFFRIFNINELGSSQQPVTKILKQLCQLLPTICASFLHSNQAINPFNLNVDLRTLNRYNNPSASSVKQMLHYQQRFKSNCFRWYDYEENNLEVYGTTTPPIYNLSLVTTPSFLFYSRGDRSVGEAGILKLCRTIRGACAGQFFIKEDDFSHVDFSLGTRAPELVYRRILGIMQKH